MNPDTRSNPFREPLLIAFLASTVALILTAAMILWRLSQPGEKAVAEFTLYGSLITVFTGSMSALGQALSRDPATARMNAAAAATNATTLADATPKAIPAVVPVVVAVPPAPAPGVDPSLPTASEDQSGGVRDPS